MAPQVPSIEPASFPAGDTVQWTKSLNDYSPADGWVLTYAFRGETGDGQHDVTCTADGQQFAALISAADSNLMNPGLYHWVARVSLAGVVHTVDSGITEVTPNLAVTNFNKDLRTSAKRALDNALEVWEKVKLGQTVMLNGRQYTQHNISQLILYVDKCKYEYAMEKALQDGENPRHILASLNRYA
jgi:hypothetical protein